MNVPSTDFKALVYIVPPALHRCEPVSSLKRGADSLETAKFVDFWQVRRFQRAWVGKNVWLVSTVGVCWVVSMVCLCWCWLISVVDYLAGINVELCWLMLVGING